MAWSPTAGARLLVDLADATGLAKAMSDELGSLRQRQTGHDPGRVVLDLAVMLADGGEAISDPAVLRNQSDLFGPVASDPTAWRVLAALDDEALSRLRNARAQAREMAWAQAAETDRLPSSTVAGFAIPGLVLDLDAHPGAMPFREGARGQDMEDARLPPTRCGASSTPPAKHGVVYWRRPGH